MQANMKIPILSLALCMMQPIAISDQCPDVIGVSVADSHTINKTHQAVKLCWPRGHKDHRYVSNYYIDIVCKHQGGEMITEEHLTINDYLTRGNPATATLHCGSYCNVSVIASHIDGPSIAIDWHLETSIDTFVAITPKIHEAIITTSNMASLLIKSAGNESVSCGDLQSINMTLQYPDASPMFHEHRHWEWNNDGDIIVRLANISYCGPTASVSIQGSEAVVMGYQPLEAPNITGVVVQDSVLTVVFADKAVICSNSSWEVCVTVDGRDETEHCSSQSAEDRLMTVDGGNGSMYGVRARVLYGDRHSPYSETTQLSATSVLPRDQLTLSNIGLPDVQLCYEVNLLSLKKVSSSAQPKHFVVHYKLCGSMDERSSNLSVNGTCQDLHGWLGGHCYEVHLFLTLDIDGLEISLNASFQAVKEGEVREGPILPLISLTAIPVLITVIGCILFAVWAKQSSARNPDKVNGYTLSKITASGIPAWFDVLSQTTIEPDIKSEYITVGSEFGASDDENQDKLGSYLGSTEFDILNPLGPKYDCQATDNDYVHVCPIPSTSAHTNSGTSGQYIKYYNKEPSQLNFSSGE